MRPARKYVIKRNPFLSEPGWTTYYEIGALACKRLPKFSTWGEVGAAIGVTEQNAYTEGVVALGKLLYRIARIIQEAPEL